MGSGGGTNTITESSKPWEGQQPYLNYMYARAQEAYEKTPKTAYPGQTLAAPNAQQQQGLGMASQVALGQIPQAQQQLQGLINNAPQFAFDHGLTSGWGGNVHWNEAARPSQLNQFIDQASTAAIRPVQEQLVRSTLPQIQNQAMAQGAYGGGRQDISEALALSEAQKNALDATSRISYQAHEAEAARAEAARQAMLGRQFSNFENNLARDFTGWQQNQDQLFRGNMASFDANTKAELARYAMAPGLIDQSIRLGGQSAEIMAGIGDTFQGWEQARLNDAQARWNAQAQAPWNGLNNYASIVAGAFPGGQSTQTSPANRASKAQGAVTGAMGGAALGGSLAAAGLVGGPIGIGLGAGLGLLGGLL